MTTIQILKSAFEALLIIVAIVAAFNEQNIADWEYKHFKHRKDDQK